MQTKTLTAYRHDGASGVQVEEALAVETILHIKVNGEPYTTTVCTPGDERLLARGLLFTDGVLPNPDQRPAFREVTDPETGLVACVEVTAPPGALEKPVAGRRSAMISASCGLCGLRDPAELRIEGLALDAPPRLLALRRLPDMRNAMAARQHAFGRSGGCHAAAVFTVDGDLLGTYEDIGRHNAVDKAIGGLIAADTLEGADCLLVSGRVSYEIVYKAYQARLHFVIGVSAPSSFAVEMAARLGMTVIGFCRDTRATVYAHPECVDPPGNACAWAQPGADK